MPNLYETVLVLMPLNPWDCAYGQLPGREKLSVCCPFRLQEASFTTIITTTDDDFVLNWSDGLVAIVYATDSC